MKTNAQLSKKEKKKERGRRDGMGWAGLLTDKHSDKQREGSGAGQERSRACMQCFNSFTCCHDEFNHSGTDDLFSKSQMITQTNQN